MDTRFRFSSDPADIDHDLVHSWLSEQSYWAQGRPRATQEQAIDASLNYAVVDSGTGRQVAYARVVSDRATFAWLCDVFVDPSVRGLGVGVGLIDGVITELDALGLRRTVLSTRDAHGLYARFGFEPLDGSSRWMVRGAG